MTPRPELSWFRYAARAVGWPLGLVLAVELVFGRGLTTHLLGVPIPRGVSLGVLLNGAILGMLYALLAFGLILVYRANRIINFAHGEIGAFGAAFLGSVTANGVLPYWVAFVLALALSATSIALRILEERGHLQQPYGQRAFAIHAHELALPPEHAGGKDFF